MRIIMEVCKSKYGSMSVDEGGIWEAYDKYVEGMWEVCGRYVGGCGKYMKIYQM